jgi:hypothetical protein
MEAKHEKVIPVLPSLFGRRSNVPSKFSFRGDFVNDTAIQEQQPAPDFTLPAVGNDDVVNNGQVHLSDLKGKTVVLYFYRKDETKLKEKQFRPPHNLLSARERERQGVSLFSGNRGRQPGSPMAIGHHHGKNLSTI